MIKPKDSNSTSALSVSPLALSNSSRDKRISLESPKADGVAEDARNASGESSEMERFREFLDHINPEDFAG